jgi:arylsulfatase A-like enzyme
VRRWTQVGAGAILLLAVLSLGAGCSKAPEEVFDGPVIVIGLDTVRGDFLSIAGMDGIQTPHLAALAADGVYFANCRSTSPWTGPSFASIFTGLYPYHHGFLGGDHLRLADEHVTVAEYFKDEGHPAGAFVEIGWLTYGFGMAQGYTAGKKIPDEGDGEASRQIVRRGMHFAQKHATEPFYLFLHFFDAHAPYTPPAPFDGMYYDGVKDAPGEPLLDFLKSERNQVFNADNRDNMYDWLAGVTDFDYPVRQYAAGVSYVDHMVGEVVAGLKSAGLYEKSLIVLVSDHGEHLGEHEIYFTHSMPFDEAIHVPLIIKWPAGQHGGTVVRAPVSTVDVLPTILAITGRKARADIDGVDLSRLADDPTAASRSVILAEEGPHPDRFVKSLVSGSWKLMVYWFDGKRVPTLFDLAQDPDEVTDVASAHPDVVDRLMKELGRVIDLDRPHTIAPALEPTARSEETTKRLRSLGYVH